MDKFLICGLGNPGDEYANTRHNTGFMVLDAFAKASNISFQDKRYGFVAETSIKGRKVILLKPTTFMNLSGNAVRYWLGKENIDSKRLLVISDDIALPLGAFRLKANGSNGGHNGLGHIQQLIGQDYPRLRMGIGNDYPKGGQIDWVLGKYTADDMNTLQPSIDTACEIIKSFVLAGIDITMNQFNKLGKKSMAETARIDKWLWAARIFKTRSIASDACKNGRVTIGGVNMKPSRSVKVGDVVSVKKPPITYSFKVLKTIEQRVGAKLLPEIYENVTDPKQYELLEMSRISGFVDRARGTGRPTKKERRALDAFVEPEFFDFDEDWDEESEE